MIQRNHIGYWEFFSNRRSSPKAWVFLIAAWAGAAVVFYALHTLYTESELYRELALEISLGQLDSSILYGLYQHITRVIAFLILPWFLLLSILAWLLLKEEDLDVHTINELRSKRIGNLFKRQLGFRNIVIALVAGLALTVLFDWHISSTVLHNIIGQTARFLADGFVFVYITMLIAHLILRLNERSHSAAKF